MTALEMFLITVVMILSGTQVWTYTYSFQRCLEMYTKGDADGYRRGCFATIDQYKNKERKTKKTKSRKR